MKKAIIIVTSLVFVSFLVAPVISEARGRVYKKNIPSLWQRVVSIFHS